MSLMDIFTGKPAIKAAGQIRGYLGGVEQTGNQNLNDAWQQGYNALVGGNQTARSDIIGGMGGARTAAMGGAQNAIDFLGGGYDDALGRSGTGTAGALGAYDPLAALSAKYGGATTLGLNALGANGEPGTAAARAAFMAGPGYQFNLDQGLDAISRRRNAAGMVDSGNADRDAQKFGAGLASNEYDKWLSNLLGFTSPELAATSGAAAGRAGLLGNQAARDAALAAASGTSKAGVAGGLGSTLADLSAREGAGLGNLASTGGQNLANLAGSNAAQRIGLSTALAQPYSQTYGQEATARMQGGANAVNLGLNLAKLAAGIPSGGGSSFFPSASFLQNGLSFG